MGIFDFILIIWILYSAWRGYSRGFTNIITSFLALIFAVLFGSIISAFLMNQLYPDPSDRPLMANLVVTIFMYVGLYAAFGLIAKSINVVLKTLQLGGINRIFGAAFQMLKVCLIVSIFTLIANRFNVLPNSLHNSVVIHFCKPLAPIFFNWLSPLFPSLQNYHKPQYPVV
ncbi:MAG: CvpA family protein [Bacteroidota bacterium]|nr:CvpA family protein [Bacteroidota bacterium]